MRTSNVLRERSWVDPRGRAFLTCGIYDSDVSAAAKTPRLVVIKSMAEATFAQVCEFHKTCGRSAFMARHDRVEILKNSAQPRGPHILIGAAGEIVHQTLRHLLREPRDS